MDMLQCQSKYARHSKHCRHFAADNASADDASLADWRNSVISVTDRSDHARAISHGALKRSSTMDDLSSSESNAVFPLFSFSSEYVSSDKSYGFEIESTK